jgi:hypothetical protein
MRLSVKSLTIAAGLLWGGCILFLGLLNLAFPQYGAAFLQMLSSIYPGFHFSRSLGDVLVGAGYGLVDGGVGGLIFAALYNLCLGKGGKA